MKVITLLAIATAVAAKPPSRPPGPMVTVGPRAPLVIIDATTTWTKPPLLSDGSGIWPIWVGDGDEPTTTSSATSSATSDAASAATDLTWVTRTTMVWLTAAPSHHGHGAATTLATSASSAAAEDLPKGPWAGEAGHAHPSSGWRQPIAAPGLNATGHGPVRPSGIAGKVGSDALRCPPPATVTRTVTQLAPPPGATPAADPSHLWVVVAGPEGSRKVLGPVPGGDRPERRSGPAADRSPPVWLSQVNLPLYGVVPTETACGFWTVPFASLPLADPKELERRVGLLRDAVTARLDAWHRSGPHVGSPGCSFDMYEALLYVLAMPGVEGQAVPPLQ